MVAASILKAIRTVLLQEQAQAQSFFGPGPSAPLIASTLPDSYRRHSGRERRLAGPTGPLTTQSLLADLSLAPGWCEASAYM